MNTFDIKKIVQKNFETENENQILSIRTDPMFGNFSDLKKFQK